MTETDTSRVERPCPNCGVTLNGYSGLRHCGTYTTHSHADCIRNLLARAEKAEAERDEANEGLTAAYLAGAHAAKRDAWNDAIEAAANEAAVGSSVAASRIRALRKGEPT